VTEVLDNPDRSLQYHDASPGKLLFQLNENWKQLRLFKLAVADRDKMINRLHQSISEQEKATHDLENRLKYSRVKIALLYSIIGGASAKGVELFVLAVVRWLFH
jgi:hypothetical protein